jgi:hypothetical protein
LLQTTRISSEQLALISNRGQLFQNDDNYFKTIAILKLNLSYVS